MVDRLIRYSSTQTFLQSRRSYLVKYIWELERDYQLDGYRPGFAFDVGNIGHAGLHAHYEGGDITAAMDAYVLDENLDPDSAEVAAGKSALDRHLLWLTETQADKGLTIVDVENRQYFEFGTFHGDKVTLTYEPDLVVRNAFGSLEIIDWKFVVSHSNLADKIEGNQQGLCYLMGSEQHYGEMPVSFTLRQTHRKPPKRPTTPFVPVTTATQWAHPDTLTRYRRQLERVIADMVQLHQEVEAGDVTGAYVTDHAGMGQTCSMSDICCSSLSKDSAEVADIISTQFRKKENSL